MIVVVASIARRSGRIMLCQRRPVGHDPSKWEFPGGKVEPGEGPERALERELQEELGIQTRTGRIYDVRHRIDGARELLLLFYFTELTGGEPAPVECSAVEWVEPERLTGYDLAPSDAMVAARLSKELQGADISDAKMYLSALSPSGNEKTVLY